MWGPSTMKINMNNYFQTLVVITLVVAVNSQSYGTCYTLDNCSGVAMSTGRVEDLEEFCCFHSSPGITRRLSYKNLRTRQCYVCPKVFGFFKQELKKEESVNPHILQLGYLSGAIPTGISFFRVSSTPGSARKEDFTLSQQELYMGTGQSFQTISVTHLQDGIAQEQVEQYSLQVSAIEGLTDYIFRGINISIVDTDTVEIYFSERDHSVNENSELVLVAQLSKVGALLATPITINIIPMTIPKAKAMGIAIPSTYIFNDPRSPSYAVEADFNATSFNVTIPADTKPFASVDVRVNIVDDDIDENYQQYFLIGAEVIAAVNPSTIRNTRKNSTFGVILDDDNIVIGFNQSSIKFEEPEGLKQEHVYLVKENNQRTEKTFEVEIQLSASNSKAIDETDLTLKDKNLTTIVIFSPDKDKIEIDLLIYPDNKVEGNEKFSLQASLINEPKYKAAGRSVFRTKIVIKDNDPIVVGFEKPLYQVNQSMPTRICVQVTSPPVEQDLNILSPLIFKAVPILNYASSADYLIPRQMLFVIGTSRANQTHSRKACSVISAMANKTSKDVRDLKFELSLQMPSQEFLVIHPNVTEINIIAENCLNLPVFINELTSTTRVLSITNSLFSSSSGSTLNDTFSMLAEKTGQKPSPETYSEFVSSIREISIAEAEACEDKSLARTLSENQLIKDFQALLKEKRNIQLMRSIVGKLLCIDSLEESPILTSTKRFKRDSKERSAKNCTCPSDGILKVDYLCEFFKCLNNNSKVLKEIIFGFNSSECLIFVVDTTGSMRHEIELTRRILLEFMKIEEAIGQWGCYMLVPFNDVGPDHKIVANASVGPIVVGYTDYEYNVESLIKFYSVLDNLDIIMNSGGDGPEYALYAMLKGLQKQDDKGRNIVDNGSQMVVITDARSKQPDLKSEVISEANNREVCIHFFVSNSYGLSDGIYQDIANKTSGTLVYPYELWKIAAFTQSYKDQPCRHLVKSRRREKRQAPAIPSPCQSFNVSDFSILLKLTINASTGKNVTLTRPNNTTRSTIVGAENLALLSEVYPMSGQWKACVSSGTVQVFAANSIALHITVMYVSSRNMVSSLPPPSCTQRKIVVATTQASKITNASLNFVDRLGIQRQSVLLQRCSDILFSNFVDLPEGSFILQLTGCDSHGNYFTYNTRINATFVPSPSYMLDNSGPSRITMTRGIRSSLKFVFRGTNICIKKFKFSIPSLPGFRTRISPSSATVNNNQTLSLTVLVSIISSRVIPGPQVITLQASNGKEVVQAHATLIIPRIEVPTVAPDACGCMNGGECNFYRGRARCSCPRGYRGRRCETSI